MVYKISIMNNSDDHRNMDSITIKRKERFFMFLNEYYFGHPTMIKVLRIIGGPLSFKLGVDIYNDGVNRFAIAAGGIMIAYSIYYTLKPLWWILIKWDSFKTIDFRIQATD
ncbi:MAG: hypothetical protein ACI8SE_001835 [Bacteroidia bacterium]|jgi:hypothetical protein